MSPLAVVVVVVFEDVPLCDLCRVPLDERDTCPACGVYHGDPCPDCGRGGYHKDDCPEMAVEVLS